MEITQTKIGKFQSTETKELLFDEKYEIVKYTPNFREQILELQKYLWSPDLDLNTAYFAWKYERNPYSTYPLIYLALHEDKVVGMRGIYGASWQIGLDDQSISAVCAGDLVVAPEHRDRGLFTKIMQAALRDLERLGYKYFFNLSAGPITFIGSLVMGWRNIGNIELMSRSSGAKNPWHFEQKRLISTLPKKEHPFYHLDQNSVKKSESRVAISDFPRPAAMASLVERANSENGIRHQRDEKFFSWRFQNPLSDYRFLFCEVEDLEGYLVLQIHTFEQNFQINIVDWETSNLNIMEELLIQTIRLSQFPLIRVWSASFSKEVKSIFEKNGFEYVKEKKGVKKFNPKVLVRPVSEQVAEKSWEFRGTKLLEKSNWNLRMIYSDAY